MEHCTRYRDQDILTVTHRYFESCSWMGHLYKRALVAPATVLACASAALINLAAGFFELLGTPLSSECTLRGSLGSLTQAVGDVILLPFSLLGVLHPAIPGWLSNAVGLTDTKAVEMVPQPTPTSPPVSSPPISPPVVVIPPSPPAPIITLPPTSPPITAPPIVPPPTNIPVPPTAHQDLHRSCADVVTAVKALGKTIYTNLPTREEAYNLAYTNVAGMSQRSLERIAIGTTLCWLVAENFGWVDLV